MASGTKSKVVLIEEAAAKAQAKADKAAGVKTTGTQTGATSVKTATSTPTGTLDTAAYVPVGGNSGGGVGAGSTEEFEKLKKVQGDATNFDNSNSAYASDAAGGTGSYSVYGNATVNPYSNAYAAYQTAMGKVKEAQLGQLNTEYNNQQKSIEGAYQTLGRNAYINYMQRAKSNNQAASNMGANRTGMAENMRTANAADYNRSVGNAGAYRQTQLSNAENAYNSSVAGVENEYATNMANAENEYRQLEIQRQNELADLQSQLDFQAQQNALDREQQAKEADRAYQQQVQQWQDQKYAQQFSNWTNKIDQYTTKAQVENAKNALKDAKSNGSLDPWQAEYYNDMMDMLNIKKASLKK